MTARSGFRAIVLAAGAGRRFGGGKLLHPLRGRPLIHHALDAAARAPVDGVLVVVGSGGDAVAAEVQAHSLPKGSPSVSVVVAPDWEEGLAASLRAAVAALPDCAGAFVFLADMPTVPTAILEPLAKAVRGGAPAAAPLYRGALGHPVLIGAGLFPAIAALRGDRGARPILDALGPALFTLPVTDPGVVRDIDEPSALIDFDGEVSLNSMTSELPEEIEIPEHGGARRGPAGRQAKHRNSYILSPKKSEDP